MSFCRTHAAISAGVACHLLKDVELLVHRPPQVGAAPRARLELAQEP